MEAGFFVRQDEQARPDATFLEDALWMQTRDGPGMGRICIGNYIRRFFQISNFKFQISSFDLSFQKIIPGCTYFNTLYCLPEVLPEVF